MTEIAKTDDGARKLALLKAVGLDRLAPEQRELALNIAKRYDLDLLLKQLVMIDTRVYITRDGLLHIAHRSGQFDGMEATEPVLHDGYWRSICSVYRKDMSRPFTYHGRYPEGGKNRVFAPEMATKVAEVMALRRAFDVAAPTQEERWDRDVEVPEPEPPPATLRERVQQKVATIVPPPVVVPPDEELELPAIMAEPMSEDASSAIPFVCGAEDTGLATGPCDLHPGHAGPHRNEGGVWPNR